MLALQYVIIIISIICFGSLLIYLAMIYLLIDKGNFWNRTEELATTKIYKRIRHIPTILICISFVAGPWYAFKQEANAIDRHKKTAIGMVSERFGGKRSAINLIFRDHTNRERTTYINLDDKEIDVMSIGQLFTVEYSYENPEFSRVILEKPLLPPSNSYTKRNAIILEISKNRNWFFKVNSLTIYYKFNYQLAPYYGVSFAPANTNIKEGDEFVYEFAAGQPYFGVLDLTKKLKKGEIIEKDKPRLSDEETNRILDSIIQVKKNIN